MLTVALGERSYAIHVGRSLLSRAAEWIVPVLAQPRAYVVTDSIVASLYLNPLESSLRQAGVRVDHAVVPAGEASKDISHLAQVLNAMIAARCERSTTVIALGGGVVGDLAGFAASVLLRGVDFIQVPTTLLAQVDSSVGGKTGINMPAGKNLVGTFHQPRLVLADTDTLTTLPRRELLAGYAEVAKYGLIADAEFWRWLESQGTAVVSGGETGHTLIKRCILTSCATKARIVGADEREAGERALLNLGHTFGHALEAEMGYGEALLHGEAVAIGMVLAFDLSARLGHASADDAARVRAHFRSIGLPVRPPRSGRHGPITPARLIAHMAQDKKVKDGAITFVVARAIGEAFLCSTVPMAAVEQTLAASLAS
jgi:3-dehydroquinate synthase